LRPSPRAPDVASFVGGCAGWAELRFNPQREQKLSVGRSSFPQRVQKAIGEELVFVLYRHVGRFD
jgi:hypothetical protein